MRKLVLPKDKPFYLFVFLIALTPLKGTRYDKSILASCYSYRTEDFVIRAFTDSLLKKMIWSVYTRFM